MQNKKQIFTLLHIAVISFFIATLISYNLPRGIKDFARHFLPAKVAKHVGFILTSNTIDFSSITIGFVGILITFGIFAGISLIFIRKSDEPQR